MDLKSAAKAVFN